MTQPRPLRSPFRPRAGLTVTALLLGSLAVSATLGVVLAPFLAQPAAAQSVANPNDQPTPATVPGRDGSARTAADRPTGQIPPPKALSGNAFSGKALAGMTDIIATNPKASTRTNPLDHLPAKDRAATGGTRRD